VNRHDLPPRWRLRLSPQSLGLLVVALAYFAAAELTWRKWPDLLVDFGEQLYLPWRLASGDVLYRDVMYLTAGPLSQYYHALLFKLFGVTLLTLVISNLAIGLGLLVLIYRRFLACSDAWTAATICLAVSLVFAFCQYSDIGNFNYITPYCHEVWHGLALSIVALAVLSRWLDSLHNFRTEHLSQETPERDPSHPRPIRWGEGSRVRGSFSRFTRTPTTSLLAAGFCAGLVFMTKPEVFVALALAFTAAFLLAWAGGQGIASIAKSLAASFLAGLLPLFAFLLHFHRFENWRDSARSVAFAWVPLLGSSVSHEPFYKWCLGLDAPGYHLQMLLLHLLIIGAVLGVCALWFRRKPDTSGKRLFTAGLIALMVALASAVDWVDCGRSLPVLALIACVLLAASRDEGARRGPGSTAGKLNRRSSGSFSLSSPKGGEGRGLEPLGKRRKEFASGKGPLRAERAGASESLEAVYSHPLPTVHGKEDVLPRFLNLKRAGATGLSSFPLLWSIFALALLAKLGLYSRIWHYGFALAMPAFVAAVYLLFWLLPSLLEKYGVQRRLFRATIGLLLMVGFLRLFVQSQLLYQNKTLAVGRGPDKIFAFAAKNEENKDLNPVGPAVQSALDWLEKNTTPETTLAVLPEGVTINYLARRKNPTKYLIWNPPELVGFGQSNMISSFRQNSPDYVLLVHRDASEYGARFFGQQEKFGLELMRWIDENYQPVWLIGHEPLRNSLFGIKLLQRRNASLQKFAPDPAPH